MPFPVSHQIHVTNNIMKLRKEKTLFMTHHFEKKFLQSKERASVCTSVGSITLETALAAPIFFFGILCFILLFEIMATRTVLKAALHTAGKEIAGEAGIYGSTYAVLLTDRLENKMVEAVGEKRLTNSLIADGREGLDCSASGCYGITTIMELSVKYRIRLPVPMFSLTLPEQEERIRIKGWSGYEGNGFISGDDEIVYITETGLVYHKDPECTHLDLSIRAVEKEMGISAYDPCRHCRGKPLGEMVYITDTGDCYHTSLACSGLKRSVYAVKKSEVYGRGGCSRCVK